MLEPFSPSFDARTIVPLPTEVAGQLVHNAVLLSGLNECISNNDFGFRTDQVTMEVHPNPENTWQSIIHKQSWRCCCVKHFHSWKQHYLCSLTAAEERGVKQKGDVWLSLSHWRRVPAFLCLCSFFNGFVWPTLLKCFKNPWMRHSSSSHFWQHEYCEAMH